MPVIPAFKKQRLKNQHDFEANLGCIVITLSQKENKREVSRGLGQSGRNCTELASACLTISLASRKAFQSVTGPWDVAE